jgi:hypothetical protein
LNKEFALVPNRREIAVLARIYSEAAKQITTELLRIDFIDYHELIAIKTEDKVKVITNRLNRLAIKWANYTVPIAYKEGYTKSVSILNEIRAEKDPFYDKAKHRASVEDYADLTSRDLIKANMSIRQNVETYLTLARQAHSGIQQLQAFDLRDEEIIANLLDDAIREGQSRGKLNQLIRRHFNRQLYERKFININGRNYDMIKYARMVARTRLRQLQSKAVENTCNQYENDLIEISDHGTETEICKEFEGNIYSISGNTPGYPALSEWPPFHPNCQHSASPTSEVAISIREQLA